MTVLNGSHVAIFSVIMLLPAHNTAVILPALSSKYKVIQLTTPDEVAETLKSINPDALLAVVSPESSKLFEKLRAKLRYPLRPLLVFLQADAPQEASNTPVPDAADFILTPSAALAQLDGLLRLRAEALHLYRQQQPMQDEIMRLKHELKSQQRIKNELEVLKNAIVRNVSHELKTPLLQVKSAVALMREEPQKDEKHNYLMELATEATGRLELLVKNITMLGESLDSNPGPLILRDTVEAARRNLRRLWEKGDQAARIVVDLPPVISPVHADKHGLTTIFQLLLDNALKFSDKAVTVKAEPDSTGGYIVIKIQDQGIGIAKDQLEAIFGMFYQVDSSLTRRYGGTGVGLALVQIILDNHGSQIKV
ncbi:MAG: HAMP domain-containing histidine kinase, partial [Armatimonadetes bacterium]|nr:HAMP domain-containing histidine kinase [Anaerolineae bacterium]